MFNIEKIGTERREFVNKVVKEEWAGPMIVTKGKIHDTSEAEGFVCVENGETVGFVLFREEDGGCELLALMSMRERRGIGSALIRAAAERAAKDGCHRLWLITTNDNTPAIRFYQKFGFRLKAVHIGAVNISRKLKPRLPLYGIDGIPIEHEFEFELTL